MADDRMPEVVDNKVSSATGQAIALAKKVVRRGRWQIERDDGQIRRANRIAHAPRKSQLPMVKFILLFGGHCPLIYTASHGLGYVFVSTIARVFGTGLQIVSIGCGLRRAEDHFEHLFGVRIIGVDPMPYKFNESKESKDPVTPPDFGTVEEALRGEVLPGGIAMLVWPSPDGGHGGIFETDQITEHIGAHYDQRAIEDLKPRFVIVFFETDSLWYESGSSGSQGLTDILRDKYTPIATKKVFKKEGWGGFSYEYVAAILEVKAGAE
jgi:hypothetical protein